MNLLKIINNIPIQILCLDKRKEVWEDLIKQCDDNGLTRIYPFIVGDGDLFTPDSYDKINFDPKLMGYWGYGIPERKHRHWNAMISHRLMVKRAVIADWPYFLLMEDDAYITKRFFDVVSKIEVPDDFDLLYLGWWKGDENDEWNLKIESDYNNSGRASLEKAEQLGGLHGIIISSSMYYHILSLPLNNPIDSQLNRYHFQIRSYFVTPKIIHTKSLMSECEGTTIQRNII